MAWITVLMAAINAIGALAKYLSDRRLIDSVQAANAAEALRRVQDALAAGDSVNVDSGRVRDPDIHQRPD